MSLPKNERMRDAYNMSLPKNDNLRDVFGKI